MIQPEIVVHLNPGDTDPIVAHELNKLLAEQMKRDIAKLGELPAHEHRFEYLRQEQHLETGETQDVLYCSGCCQFRFRRVGSFRPVTSW